MNETTHIIDAKSLIGGRSEQQDASGFVETKHGLFAVVCDGMGGANGGATASRFIVKNIIDSFNNYNGADPVAAIKEAIGIANAKLFKLSQSNDELKGMGTTVAALLLQKHHATAFHVGDSRVYQIKNGEKWFRTFDHSRVFEMVRQGVMTEEQARLSNQSNVILKALGIKPDVEIEVNDYLPYQKGDRFLICSDGISGAITEEELIKQLAVKDEVRKINFELINKVDTVGKLNGGRHDNLTAILIQCTHNSILKTPLSMKSKLVIALSAGLVIISTLFAFDHISQRSKIDTLTNENQVLKTLKIDAASDSSNKSPDIQNRKKLDSSSVDINKPALKTKEEKKIQAKGLAIDELKKVQKHSISVDKKNTVLKSNLTKAKSGTPINKSTETKSNQKNDTNTKKENTKTKSQ